MGDHAGPGGDQAEAQQLGTKEGTHNAHGPHADNVIYKGCLGFANAQYDLLKTLVSVNIYTDVYA